MLTVTPDMDAKLREFEAEQAAEPETPDTTGQPIPDADRPAPAAPVESEPVPQPTETSPDAEKAEIESATKDAEKQGQELVKDDKGKYVRDAQGKFTTKAKAPVKDPKIVGLAEQMKGYTREQAQAVWDELFPSDSKYAKENARRDNSWKALNDEKSKFATERKAFDDSIKEARARLQADVDAFKSEQEASVATPDKFDKWAQAEASKAQQFEAAAKTAEENFEDEAKISTLKAKAAEARGLEQRAKQYADELRKNPPKTPEQNQAQFKADQQSWIEKSKIDFPEFKKQDSEVQKGAIQYYNTMVKSVPMLAKLPGFIYFAAERAELLAKANQFKSASEKVSALEKENGELQAKVKELDALTNPTPKGGVARVNPASRKNTDDEEYEALRQMAAQSLR